MASSLASPALRHVRPSSLVAGPSRRCINDLVIQTQTQKPIIRYGTGGRSSVSGHTATVFGASGFLGRYVVEKLAKQGTQVIVPYRFADEARLLRVMGDLGQIVPLEWDLRNEQQIAECLRHSDVVYNLVGRDHETRNFKFDDVHNLGARRIAKIAKEHDVARFIHVSHLNADVNSTSTFYQSKGKGEIAVREEFPEATIVRPSAIYGYEDRLLNDAAKFPFKWSQNLGRTIIRPVHFVDVAEALKRLMDAELSSVGQTYNLAGPKTFTHAEFLAFIRAYTLDPKHLTEAAIPKPLLKLFATLTNKFLWWPTMDADFVERQNIDERTDTQIRHLRDGSLSVAESWDRVGIEPDTMEEHALKYLKMHRKPFHYTKEAFTTSMYDKKRESYRVIQ